MAKLSDVLNHAQDAAQVVAEKSAALDSANAELASVLAKAHADYNKAVADAQEAYDLAVDAAQKARDLTEEPVKAAADVARTAFENAKADLAALRSDIQTALGAILEPQDSRVRIG